MPARITQSAAISITSGTPNPRLNQVAVISVAGPPSTPSLISQVAIISVVMSNRKYVQLGTPIKLNCWQPCSTYATYSPIIKLGE